MNIPAKRTPLMDIGVQDRVRDHITLDKIKIEEIKCKYKERQNIIIKTQPKKRGRKPKSRALQPIPFICLAMG